MRFSTAASTMNECTKRAVFAKAKFRAGEAGLLQQLLLKPFKPLCESPTSGILQAQNYAKA